MKFFRKYGWKLSLIFVLILGISASGLVIWAGSEIASPSRRALMDYHREYLTNSSAHGIHIHPFTASDGTPCLVVLPDSSGNLGKRGSIIRQELAARGILLKPAGSIIGTLVLCHGRKGRKEDYLPIAERLCAVGFRCVIPDLPGHGDHPAKTATYGIREATLPAKILTEAAAKFSFDPNPTGLLGMSMGGSVAMHAADLPAAPWKALVIISSFDSLPATIEGQASRHSGTLLGPLWADAAAIIYQEKTGVSLADIQPRRHAAKIRIPTLVAHGSADTVISIASGRRLFDALPETTVKQWIEIPGAGHDNVLITSYPIYGRHRRMDVAARALRH